VSSPALRRIGGALAQFWAGGSGPSRAQIQSALLIAGYTGSDEGNKQQLVLSSIVNSDDQTARAIIVELISLLRESHYFEYEREGVARFRRVAGENGVAINEDGHIDWGAVRAAPTTLEQSELPLLRSDTRPNSVIDTPNQKPPVTEVSSPDLSLLASSLRRLGSGALRPLVHRRRNRDGISINDEYDLQDATEMLLRSLYSDVRREEPTPSSAGSHSRMDLYLREGRTAVEVKATSPGRSEKQIKPELLTDINDYLGHPTVESLVIVIYDLANTFENPVGFEHDLSGIKDGLEVRVIVVPWVGPRFPLNE
jgi:hypothetical protein